MCLSACLLLELHKVLPRPDQVIKKLLDQGRTLRVDVIDIAEGSKPTSQSFYHYLVRLTE